MRISSRTRGFLLATLVGACAAGLGWLASNAFTPVAAPSIQHGTLLAPPKLIPPFRLVDQEGHPVTAATLKDRWSLVFFGFTSCPEVCPVTLEMLADVSRQLRDLPAASQPRVVLVTVDPERDTPERLRAYLEKFDGDFIGLSGESAEIARFAGALGVIYMKVPMANGNYMMDHSTSIMAIDPQGRLAAVFSAPQNAQSLARDLRQLAGN